MLENELWGNTIENWGISILIILGAIIIVIPSAVVNMSLGNLDRYPSVGLSGQFCESC